MSDKRSCLGCGEYHSSIHRAYQDGDPCPFCGFPADASVALELARKKGADEKLIQKAAEMELRAINAETELHRLRTLIDNFEESFINMREERRNEREEV